MKNYSQNHPYVFSLIIFFVGLLFAILVQLPTIPFSDQRGVALIIEGFGRAFMSLPFIYLLSRFGWLKEAGFQFPKVKKVWLLVALVVPYLSASWILPIYKSLVINFPDMLLGLGIIVSFFGGSLYEETIYRGVIQTTFYKKCAGDPKGVFKAVIVSALYFGISHLVGLASGSNPILIIAMAIYSIGLGIFFSALLVYSKSIWPAIIAHWLLNCALNFLARGLTNPSNKIFLIMSIIIIIAVLLLTVGAVRLLWLVTKNQVRNG